MKTAGFISLIVVLLSFGCKDKDERRCWKKAGETITEERLPGAFNKLEIYDHIDVILVEDSTFSISIETGKNLVQFINTDLSDSTLTLTDDNGCDWLRDLSHKPTITIHAPALTEITQFGTGDLTSADTLHYPIFYRSFQASGDVRLKLNTTSSRFEVQTGPANVYASGHTDYLYLYHSGTGNAYTSDLIAQQVQVNSVTTGEFRVHVTETLGVEIQSRGNVYYSGDPVSITSSVSGEGQLIAQ